MRIPPELPRISDYAYYYADTLPDRDALVFNEERISYAALRNHVRTYGQALLAAGIRKGDRVAMLSTPRPEFLIALLATVDIGAIWVGLNPRYQIEELRYVVGDAQPKVLISIAKFEGRDYTPDLRILKQEFKCITLMVTMSESIEGALNLDTFLELGNDIQPQMHEAARNAVESMDPAIIVYTSGTTGQPKGALLKHYSMIFLPRNIFIHRYHDHPKIICNLPINHAGAVTVQCCPIYIGGGTIYFMERFDPKGVLALIAKERITYWGQVATMYQLMVNLPEFGDYDLSSIEWLIWGGSRMAKDLILKLKSLGFQLWTQYGQTELSGTIAYTDREAELDVLAETAGRPDPALEFRIIDEDGKVCPTGVAGEIQVRHECVMLGYYNRPEATQEVFTQDGFIKTGDIGVLRPDGNLRFVGRIREMFKSGGYNIYPREIEQAIEEHPAVELVAVIGVPDKLYAEVGHAFVIPKPGYAIQEGELNAWCHKRLANYKIPKRFFVSKDFPLLPVGKIDKQALKRMIIEKQES